MQSECTAPEAWRPVVGYEGWYSVSSYGRVRRDAAWHAHPGGMIRHPYLNPRGYLHVTLSRPGRPVKSRPVHGMVAQAFLPPRPGVKGVNHINGIKTDNRVENLEWATHQENMAHAVATGLMHRGARSPARKYPGKYAVVLARRTAETTARGERNGSARLTQDAVLDILTSLLTGTALAAKYHVGQSTISRVRRRTHWKHVPSNAN